LIRATLRDPKRLALGVYIACFSIGATTHAVDFLTRGFRPYAGVPFVFEAFWTSLILLDLAVVVFLITGRLRAGLALGAAVMIADVVVNFHAMTRLDMSRLRGAPAAANPFSGLHSGIDRLPVAASIRRNRTLS
jgi:hypothetical protein